jgi:hypothetical protein
LAQLSQQQEAPSPQQSRSFVLHGETMTGKTSLHDLLAAVPGPKPLIIDEGITTTSDSKRWGAPKDNRVNKNTNTLRANKGSVRSMASWLLDTHKITKTLKTWNLLSLCATCLTLF